MKRALLSLLAISLLLTGCTAAAPTPETTTPSVSSQPTTVPVDSPEPTTQPEIPPETKPENPDQTEPRVEEEYCGELCITREVYDAQGRLVSRTSNQCYDMELRRQEYEYDDQGHVVAETCFAYGWEHCQKRMSYQDGSMTGMTLLEYDYEADDFVAVANFVYTYDAAGNRISETFYQNDQPKYTYEFGSDGALVRHVTYRDGVPVETKNPDKLVKLQLITGIYAPILDNDPISRTFSYDGTTLVTLPDMELSEKEIDGQTFLLGVLEYDDEGIACLDEYLLDQNHRLTKRVLYENGEQYAQWTYDYDDRGNLTEETEWYSDSEQRIWTHTYDGQGRVTGTSLYEGGELVNQIRKEYNAQGFMVRETDSVTGEETLYTHNELGQVTGQTDFLDGVQTGEQSWQYDSMGNLILESEAYQYEYHYDEDGLLTSVRHIWGDEVYGDAFLEYRVVYVTAEEAVALLRETNEALNWALGY